MDHDDDRPPFVPIERDPDFYASRLRRKTAIRWPWAVAGFIAAMSLLLVLWLVVDKRRPPAKPLPTKPLAADEESASLPPATSAEMSNDQTAASRLYTVRNDDGTMLWIPPGNGHPIDLRNCPTGAQCLLYLRPADLIRHPEGLRCWRAIDFEAVARKTAWEQTHQAELSEISEMILTWVPRGPDIDLVTTARWDQALPEAWRGRGESVSTGWPTLRWIDSVEQSVLLPEQDRPTIVWGPKEQLQSIAEGGGRPPYLRREMESLWRHATTNQQVILLLPPRFLSRDGRQLLESRWRQLAEGMDWLFGDGVQAVMMAAEIDRDEVFLELRAIPIWESRVALAQHLPARMRRLPQLVEDWIVAQPEIDPFWRRLVLRLPAMVRFAVGQLRSGVEGREVIVNLSLPAKAAHNLLLGAHWAMGQRVATAASEDVSAPGVVSTPALLDLSITLSFRQESLESALAGLEDVVGEKLGQHGACSIELDGRALQLEGITRNQQLRNFQAIDMPVRDVLNLIVAGANPDRSVKGLADSAQELVWLVKSSNDGSTVAVIRITTRAAAEREKWELPEDFRIP